MDAPDEYAILAAIWILASNDETSLITYRGIQQRLNLPVDYDVRALVTCHGELFRQRIPFWMLKKWQGEMRQGKHRPAWIREAREEERETLIDSLTPDDGFRSQFRSELSAPRSDIAVIEWGLGHIERLRKAKTDAREASAKSWQIWLVFATSILGVAATIVVALIKH
jgi:hypothetical protein